MDAQVLSRIDHLNETQVCLISPVQWLVLILEMLNFTTQVVHSHLFLHLLVVYVELNDFLQMNKDKSNNANVSGFSKTQT